MREFFMIILTLSCVSISLELSCKDDRGRNVDWIIAIKLPKISSEPKGTPLEDGEAYAFISSKESNQWKLSTQNITSEKSFLGRTWQELKKIEKTATYLFYNDETPDTFKGTAVGHAKGYLAFNNRAGFWVIHSIPKYGILDSYEYPASAHTNGQHVICVSFKVSELDKICQHLLYVNPNIYLKHLSDQVSSKLSENSRSLFSDKPAFIKSGDLTKQEKLKSAGGQEFISFAKDNQYDGDLYSDVIAPELKYSFFTETWRRGAGKNLQPACVKKYPVIDIAAINLKVNVRKNEKSIYFKSKEDHSKWAVSDKGGNFVCMADINRMASQAKRGGGALCIQSSPVWKAFKSSVNETENCPTRR